MQRSNMFETPLSALVILAAVGFLVFTLWQTGTGSLKSYEMNARLKSADGLKPGTDVKIAGVKVGEIQDLTLRAKPYAVDVKLTIRDDIRIPEDSRLSVANGTLSSAALTITPGHAKVTVPDGGTLKGK